MPPMPPEWVPPPRQEMSNNARPDLRAASEPPQADGRRKRWRGSLRLREALASVDPPLPPPPPASDSETVASPPSKGNEHESKGNDHESDAIIEIDLTKDGIEWEEGWIKKKQKTGNNDDTDILDPVKWKEETIMIIQ